MTMAKGAPRRGGHVVATEANMAIARRFFADVVAAGNARAISELIAPGAVVVLPTGRFEGPEGVKRASAQLESAFPDLRVEVKSLAADAESVTARWRLCGTQRRELLGVPPSGRRECVEATSLLRVEGNRIVAHWMTEG
jgi:C-1 hydroxylase